MTVDLQEVPSGTQIIAATQSQWFILGDALDYYNGYLRDFFGAVQAELQTRGAITGAGSSGAMSLMP